MENNSQTIFDDEDTVELVLPLPIEDVELLDGLISDMEADTTTDFWGEPLREIPSSDDIDFEEEFFPELPDPDYVCEWMWPDGTFRQEKPPLIPTPHQPLDILIEDWDTVFQEGASTDDWLPSGISDEDWIQEWTDFMNQPTDIEE